MGGRAKELDTLGSARYRVEQSGCGTNGSEVGPSQHTLPVDTGVDGIRV